MRFERLQSVKEGCICHRNFPQFPGIFRNEFGPSVSAIPSPPPPRLVLLIMQHILRISKEASDGWQPWDDPHIQQDPSPSDSHVRYCSACVAQFKLDCEEWYEEMYSVVVLWDCYCKSARQICPRVQWGHKGKALDTGC